MSRSRLAIATALALACAALTGAAFAGPPDDAGKSASAPGQQSDPGKSEQAPGQVKTSKAATPSKGKSSAAKVKSEPQGGPKPAGHDGPHGKSALARDHVILCHWAAHKWVLLNVPKTSVHFDDKHPDKVLVDNEVDPGEKASDFNMTVANCGAPPEGEVLSVTEVKKEEGCPPVTTVTKTTTETKVEHKAGKKGKIVEISPSDKSAHVRKHGEKKTTTVKTETKVVAQGECPGAAQLLGAPGQPAPTVTPTGPAAEAVGEVAGVQAALPTAKPKAKAAKKPAGGVLGALGAVAGEDLPFTGLPLWIAALIGVGLVGAGFGARRAIR